jgi:hypothetical protein
LVACHVICTSIKKKRLSDFGICENFDDWHLELDERDEVRVAGALYSQLYDVRSGLFEAWPKWSGRRSYPVPCPKGGSPEEAFDNTRLESFWDRRTAYGRLRHELLDFMIEQLDVEIAQRA